MRCGKSANQKMMKPNRILESKDTMTLGIDQNLTVNFNVYFLKIT